MDISVDLVKELREKTGAGIMECKKALQECDCNLDKALEALKQHGFALAEKKAERQVGQGLVDSYIHPGNRIGCLIEVNCETDFVARTDDFKNLVHNLAMQVTAMNPVCVSKEDLKENVEAVPEQACLLLQPFIKDNSKSIQDIIKDAIAKTGENIKVRRFMRFELGAE